MSAICERDGELRSKVHATGLQWKKKAVQSQSGESTNTVSKFIVDHYCSVIIGASFSDFIIQLLMVILGVAILVTSFSCFYLVLINRAGGLYGRILTEVASTDRTQ